MQQLPRLHPAPWQRVLLEELKGRPNLKLHVISVRKHFQRSSSFEWDGVTFHCLKVPGGLRTLSLFWWETLLIRKLLKRVGPDLVHAWGSERAAALVASRLPHPYLVTMQGLLQWISQQVKQSRLERLEAWLEPSGLKRASVVTAESSFAVSWLQEHYPHLEVRQAEHAPAWLFHRQERRPQIRPLQLVYAAQLSLLKGADLLLLALDRLRHELDFRLTAISMPAPGFMPIIKAKVSSSLWERVNFRHSLTPPEVAEELSRAALMVYPTRADNSPNSVKEAVVAGVPVICSAMGGMLDYVVPDKNGLRFAPGNVEQLINAVRAAAAHPLFGQGKVDPETLARMRLYLSPRTMGDRFVAAYRQVHERRPMVSSRATFGQGLG